MTDITLDTKTGDLVFINGDIAYGESTLQHQRDLLQAHPGDYRYAPTVGVGVQDFAKDDDPENMLRAIAQQFVQDGMTINKIVFANNKVSVDASY